MSPLARSLLALASLLAAAESAQEKVLFGINTPHFVRLNEVTMRNQGGLIKVKNYCPSSMPQGTLVVARNGYYDRDPYVDGTIFNLSVTCRPLGPYTTCNNPIKVNITQFC